MFRQFNVGHMIMAAFAAMMCGCTTYTSPFVHKTEEELDQMESRDEIAASRFAKGAYSQTDTILKQLTEEPTVSRPLYELERVSVLLQRGNTAEAHELMMKVRGDFEMLFDEQSEKEAASLWHGENKKVFKGDAHERATLYAFLAMSFMDYGDWDNAERSVKNGLLADSANTKDERYNSDYALLQYLGYVACRKGGRDADAENYMKELRSTLVGANGSSPAYDLLAEAPLPNAFLVVWAGSPPSYARGGAHKEIRYAIPGARCPFSFLSAQPDGGDEFRLAGGIADINFQATTRGGRAMDEVLSNKAAVKTGLKASKNVLILVGFSCLASMGSNAKANIVLASVGGGCILAGLTFHVIGECINSSADIRCWKNLPGELLIMPLYLPEGEHGITVRGYEKWDNVVSLRTSLAIKPDAVVTRHVSLMQHPYGLNAMRPVVADGVSLSDSVPIDPSRFAPVEIVPSTESEEKPCE